MRILIVRLDGIGDALACTPLVAALRDADHSLGIALTTRNASIFARETFAWTHVLARNPWPKHGHARADVERTMAECRAIGYDCALVASEEVDAYSLARACARRRVGFVNAWEKPLKTLLVRRLLDRALTRPASAARAKEHEVVTLFRLGDGLHAESGPTRDPRRLAPLVVDAVTFDLAARRSSGPYLAVQLTPKWAALGITHERLAGIVRGLRARAPIRVLCSEAESAQLHAIAGVLESDVAGIDGTVFSGEEGMRAWKRAIADAAVLISPDTGASNLAGMIGTPCVAVFPSGRLGAARMRRWAPWAGPSVAIQLNQLDQPDDAAIVGAAGELYERTCAHS
ncbi:MAG: glycosyltransferase family 9 protein [Candidatus Eremiobacteraeota bacterium]|nr:glycosyltransferase family 9 protein [Candidatus Eremiobacteraeota bacterium]